METLKQQTKPEIVNYNDMTLQQFWVTEIQNKSKEEGHNYTPEEGNFRASSLPYCRRKIILRKNPSWVDLEIIEQKIEKPVPLSKATSGHSVHEFIQKIVKDSNQVIAIEPYVKKTWVFEREDQFHDVTIEGHIDLILMLGNGINIIDIKSFERNQNYDILRYLPNSHHIDQLAVYQLITSINKTQLLYVSRSDFEPLFFPIELDNLLERSTNMLEKVMDLRMNEINHTLPDKLSKEWDDYKKIEKFNWECNYCEFQSFCFPKRTDIEKIQSNG